MCTLSIKLHLIHHVIATQISFKLIGTTNAKLKPAAEHKAHKHDVDKKSTIFILFIFLCSMVKQGSFLGCKLLENCLSFILVSVWRDRMMRYVTQTFNRTWKASINNKM